MESNKRVFIILPLIIVFLFSLPFQKISGKLMFIFEIPLIPANFTLFFFALCIAGFLLFIHFKFKHRTEQKIDRIFITGGAGLFSILLFFILSPRFNIVFAPIAKYNIRLIIAFFSFTFLSSSLFVIYKHKLTNTGKNVLFVTSGITASLYLFPVFGKTTAIPIFEILKSFSTNIFTGFILLLPLILIISIFIHIFILEKQNNNFIQFCSTVFAGFAPAVLWFTAVNMSSPLHDFSAITYGTVITTLWIIYQILINFGALSVYSKGE